jgi:hypothetical protein
MLALSLILAGHCQLQIGIVPTAESVAFEELKSLMQPMEMRSSRNRSANMTLTSFVTNVPLLTALDSRVVIKPQKMEGWMCL